jgi:type 1 glutamine amidotransferase
VKSALFVCGGWEGHEPEKCAGIFVPFLQGEEYEVEISRTLDSYLDEDKMRSLDLVVQV